jgi:hypothetical protein
VPRLNIIPLNLNFVPCVELHDDIDHDLNVTDIEFLEVDDI